ncbi:MAG: filamentous hemagglutinin N-terminal domain-containing protein, partial [Campylobacterales bacterium]|nr:filamentous hemagglutinin N-terminal domain-containing protein [Campylobacterales bacterium]
MKNRFSQIIAFIQLSLLLSSNVFAEVVVDLTAAANKQAQLKQAANGMTYVNIQAPNSSGLSHNVYTKFNVDPVGLVLNNSVGDTQTKLAGWIEGNTLLGGKSAKTILNEVNSNNPSMLRGFIEVAGSKANVIVANPNGIMVDGAGFINVNRGVLTTGAPVVTNGDLTGYRVTDGHISIDGMGMDASDSDYTDIISRTAKLNSKIWANNLNIVAGTNDVSFDTKTVTSNSSSSPAPLYAIDTGALGGMYAGKIRLVATEVGVGVRNNGEISAGSELTISVNGKLENASKIYSAGSIFTSSSSDTVNSGTMYSAGDMSIDTNATLNNSGLIASYGSLSAKAKNINMASSSTFAAGLDENATISRAQSVLAFNAESIDNKADILAANVSIDMQGNGTIDNTGTINAVNTYINVQSLNNQVGGKIYGDNVALQAVNLNNYSMIASRNDLNIGAVNILNANGASIYSLGNMYIGGALDANKLATGRA